MDKADEATSKQVRRISSSRLPTSFGEFTAYAYETLDEGSHHHIALVKGDISHGKNVLVRVHSECLTGDVFDSKRCDCGYQLKSALAKIAEEGRGVLVYLRGHEGRGIGLAHKLQAYTLQDEGLDTVEANEALGLPVDAREYRIGAEILADLGIISIRLLTNNPAKHEGLTSRFKDIERVPLPPLFNDENLYYLKTKQKKLGHLLDI